ncbi:oligosaccharide flippase family protein, partial [bacterium]|nr:oligosaccharide flippase family protein [bacterium]
MSTKRKASLTKQAGMLMVGRSIAYAISFVLPLVLVRVFTRVEFGLYKQLFLVFFTAFPILQFGMAQSLYYFLPRNEDRRDGVVLHTFSFLLIMGMVAVFIINLLKAQIGAYFNSVEIVGHLPALSAFTFFMLGSVSLEILLIADERTK